MQSHHFLADLQLGHIFHTCALSTSSSVFFSVDFLPLSCTRLFWQDTFFLLICPKSGFRKWIPTMRKSIPTEYCREKRKAMCVLFFLNSKKIIFIIIHKQICSFYTKNLQGKVSDQRFRMTSFLWYFFSTKTLFRQHPRPLLSECLKGNIARGFLSSVFLTEILIGFRAENLRKDARRKRKVCIARSFYQAMGTFV